MAKRLRFISRGVSSFARRRSNLCILITDGPQQAAIQRFETNMAVLEMRDAPGLGAEVELHHPEVGVLRGKVVGVVRDTVRVAFAATDRAARFAQSTLLRGASA